MTTISGFGRMAEELERFADAIEEIGDEADKAIDRGTRKTALQVESTAKKNLTDTVDTGELRRDLQATKIALGVYSVGSTKEYAEPHEYGSKPHPITPNGPYPLRFQVDGEWVSTYHVDHPGHRAYPFLRPALNQHRQDLIDNIAEELEELVDEEL